MVRAIIFKAPVMIMFGILEFFLHKSSINDLRLLKGESNTAALMYSDFPRYKRPVTAPIDLPHMEIEVI